MATRNPHEEVTLTKSRPSTRGAPPWADDPDEVARELAAMDQRDAQNLHGKREKAHVAAHRENIRRNRSAQSRADRSAAAAANKAQADADAASIGGRAKTLGGQANTIGSVTSGGGLRIDDASGFVLALLAWSWVVLPFLDGGATGVRNMLRAKFFNKGPDGKYLP